MDNKTRFSVATLVVSAATIIGIGLNEGYRSDAYKDSVGVATIGFGETAGVKMGQKTTPERALVQLLKSTEKHADAIRQCISVPLYQHEFNAYVSLAYNIGATNFCRSTLVRKLNAKDYAGACSEIKKWNGVKEWTNVQTIQNGEIKTVKRKVKKELPGLTKRRNQEYRMCMGEA